MPAFQIVFQIVSRSSGKALRQEESPFVDQVTQNAQDPAQWWLLTPQDTADDLLIQPAASREQAIGVGQQPNDPRVFLKLQPVPAAQVWRISLVADPPYFFLIEGNNDVLMDVPDNSHTDGVVVQVSRRTEHPNQQWTFLPVFHEQF